MENEIRFENLYTAKPLINGHEDSSPQIRPWREIALKFFLFFVFLFLSAFLFKLQVLEGAKNLALSKGNRIRISPLYPERGTIFDVNGISLARNKPSFRVNIDVSEKEVPPATLSALSQNLKISKAKIEEQVALSLTHKEAVVSLAMVDREMAIKLEQLKLENVFLETEPVRAYGSPVELAHIIGYIGEVAESDLSKDYLLKDKIGRSGVEKSAEEYLQGTKGQKISEVDSSGKTLGRVYEQSAIAGKDVYLSIDSELQKKAYELLEAAVEAKKADGGAVVAQDPATGKILALVSYPSFDPSAFIEGNSTAINNIFNDESKPLFNRAISGAFPPGSAFKIIMASAVSEEEVVEPTWKLDDKGGISVGSFTYMDWQAGGHGLVDLRRALQVSCDTYFYTVGGGYGGVTGLGLSRIRKWSDYFGFGETLGIDLPGEVSGLVPSEEWKEENVGEPWYIGNTYHLSIGQGYLLATPLQVNGMTAVIASGGVLWKPQVLEKVVDRDGETVKEFLPTKIREGFLSKTTIQTVREGLRMAVEPGGTGYPMQELKVKTAGKTGTSEFGPSGKTHAWFTVYAPYSEKYDEMPKIVLTVFLENGGEGSDDAAPLARDILKYYFKE